MKKDKKLNIKVPNIPLPKIPIFSLPDRPVSTSSEDLFPVADIKDDGLVLLKSGGACLVMESTSLNFGLLSEKEQQAVIAAYSAMINSLSFSIQILVRSQKKDISKYLEYLDERYNQLTNNQLKTLMADYRVFVRETIKKRRVLSKSFYVVVPFSPLELGISKSFFTLTQRQGPLPFPESYIYKKAKTVLLPRRDHLSRQAGRLGLKLRQLSRPELIDLFYGVYNPEPPEEKENKNV